MKHGNYQKIMKDGYGHRVRIRHDIDTPIQPNLKKKDMEQPGYENKQTNIYI